MTRNLDIWAVQRISEELPIALGNIKTDNDLILYTNLICDFKIGDIDIRTRQFDKVLYSEDNDVLIMFMRNGAVDIQDIKKYLDDKGFSYSEVSFAPSVALYDDEFDYEIWFAREQAVLDDAVADSLAKGVSKSCDYFPFLKSNLGLGYITNDNSTRYDVDGRDFMGILRFSDKLVLFVKGDKSRDITSMQVNEILKKYGVNCIVLENSDFNLAIDEMSKYSKKMN